MDVRIEFDRGTLLLRTEAPRASLRDLPGVLWDPRVECLRAPAWRYADLVAELGRRGGGIDDRAAPTERARAGDWRPIDLRPYQQAALCAWELAGRRGVVALPTGSGKTRLALAAMATLGLSALCLVPTRVLMHQWRVVIAGFYAGRVACWGDRERQCAPITVMTFESAYRRMAELGRRWELLVVDEAHHFGAGMRDEALEMSVAPFRLGLSATPPASGIPAADRLVELVGPTVYELRVADLAGSYLAPFDLIELRLPLDAAERRRYEQEMSAFRAVFGPFRRFCPRASWHDFLRAAARTEDGRRAVAAWRRARSMLALTRAKRAAVGQLLAGHRQGRVLIFTADNDAAYAIAREQLIMPLTCDIGRAEREHVLARLRSGELRALVSARVLNEGIDLPDADVAIVVGGSLGEREHVQRIGRLLRPGPGKRAVVYELVAAGTSEQRQAERRRRGLAPAIAA
ncbi:MAG: DEAD/DEAH box helicase [Deltaproteobacteria bacterium]|nr:DEAD/DEAH box helicase [Deltaproteobacteria bacterium]